MANRRKKLKLLLALKKLGKQAELAVSETMDVVVDTVEVASDVAHVVSESFLETVEEIKETVLAEVVEQSAEQPVVKPLSFKEKMEKRRLEREAAEKALKE